MFEDTSADFLSGGLRSDRKQINDSQKLGNVEPNLADVDAMLRMHGVNSDGSGDIWKNIRSVDSDPLAQLNSIDIQTPYDPNSA